MPRRDLCPHRPPCPGCPRFGARELAPEAIARLAELAHASDLPMPELHAAPGLGHRHRARLAIRGRARSPKIGLFQAGSHRIVDTPRCAIHHPLINDTARVLREVIRETGIEPYADRPHRGVLRYVQIVVERETQRVQVVLVGNGDRPEILGALPAAFEARLGDRLQGLFFNAQPERSNAILGPHMHRLAGDEALCETLAGVPVFFPPAAFGQNHLPLYEHAIERIAALVPRDRTIAEFYCGVGSIGLGLLNRARAVRFNERSPAGLAGLELGLAERPARERERAAIVAGAAGESLTALDGADVVIVDPPRRGLDPALREALSRTPPRRLIYLACGLERLIDDLHGLIRPDGLKLQGIEAFDFFPFTEHVETLVWLDRNGEQSEEV